MMAAAQPGPFFDASADPALTLDGAGRVLRANAAFVAMAGPGRAPAPGAPLAGLLDPARGTALARALEGSGEATLAAALRADPGRELSWRLAPAAGGGWFVCVRDVSFERRHLDAVERLTGVGSWESRPGGGRSQFSAMAHELFGCDPSALSREERLGFYVGTDRKRICEAVAALERDGTPFELEVEFRDAAGRRRWMHVTGGAERSGGVVARVRGTLRDVTAERERRSRLERLGAVARSTGDAVMIADPRGRIEWVNAAFTAQLGHAPEAVMGWALDALASPSTDSATAARRRDALADGRGMRAEIACRHRDGHDVWVQMDLRPMRREGGGPDGWICVHADVSERREAAVRLAAAERDARRSRARLEAAVDALEDAFVLYDPDDRLVMCNQRFRDVYALTAAALVPGTPFEEILRHGIARGQWPDAVGREEAWLAERLQACDVTSGPVERRVAGGRLMRIVERRTADGSRVGLQMDVTEQREAEARLARAEREARESHGRLTTAIDALDDGFLLFDAETRLVAWNDRIKEMYPRQAPAIAQGRRFEDILRYGIRQGQWPEAQGREEAWIAERLRAQREAGRPFERRLADGRWIRVVERVTPDGGRVALQVDITEQREAAERLERAEREARESREQLITAIEALDDGFTFYDRDERLVLHNSRYLEIYPETAPAIAPGVAYETVMRYGLERGQYPQAAGREEEWLAERLAEHRAEHRTVEIMLPGDRWLRIKGRSTPDGGRVGLRVDITEMKRQQRDLEEARARAEAASEAKSRFLATMSHEIRTPMNGMLGLVDLLAEGAADGKQRALLRDVQQSGETLLAILNDVLDFSKIEAGQMTLEAIAFDPAELARRVERLHGPSAREKGLALRLEVEDGPHRVGDPTRLLQVAGNLVSNAVKFTEEGSVTLRVANPEGGALRLEIVDTGIGMGEEQIACAFERFAQADTSVTRRFGGTGLGLSIVRGLVEAMGGRVEIDSAVGRGTRVAVEAPLPLADAVRAAAAAPEPVDDLAGMRILAADDNAANRRVLARLLERLGATATIVDSGAEAVAEAAGGRFDLMLLDISMPEVDGVEARRRIAHDAAASGRPPAPALAVTANAMKEQVEGYLAAGFDGCVPKPLRLAALARACRHAVEGSTVRRAG